MTRTTYMLRKTFFAGLAVLTMTGAASAALIGVQVDPPNTAGGGANSTRSSVGSFHVYAMDDNSATNGISSYSITFSPSVSASNNRSPVTSIQDGNTDVWTAGFNLLRTASNANPMTGSQNLPGQTPYLITGIGKTSGDFPTLSTTTGVQPGTVVGPTTSGSWGGAYNNGVNSAFLGPHGEHWTLLGEGLYTGLSAS